MLALWILLWHVGCVVVRMDVLGDWCRSERDGDARGGEFYVRK
jgi:hypothetical protein